jgi:hypothetical protein
MRNMLDALKECPHAHHSQGHANGPKEYASEDGRN